MSNRLNQQQHNVFDTVALGHELFDMANTLNSMAKLCNRGIFDDALHEEALVQVGRCYLSLSLALKAKKRRR